MAVKNHEIIEQVCDSSSRTGINTSNQPDGKPADETVLD